MAHTEHPTLYLSSGFRELAHGAHVTNLQTNPPGIDVVLRRGNERYALNEISTALGGLILLSSEENPLDGDVRIYQVAQPDKLKPPVQSLAIYDQPLRVDEALSAAQNSLVVPGAEPDETSIAWALYNAAQAKGGNPTADLMGRVPDMFSTLGRILGGAKTPAGLIFEGLGQAINPLAGGLLSLKRQADKQAVEGAKPVRLTHRT